MQEKIKEDFGAITNKDVLSIIFMKHIKSLKLISIIVIPFIVSILNGCSIFSSPKEFIYMSLERQNQFDGVDINVVLNKREVNNYDYIFLTIWITKQHDKNVKVFWKELYFLDNGKKNKRFVTLKKSLSTKMLNEKIPLPEVEQMQETVLRKNIFLENNLKKIKDRRTGKNIWVSKNFRRKHKKKELLIVLEIDGKKYFKKFYFKLWKKTGSFVSRLKE